MSCRLAFQTSLLISVLALCGCQPPLYFPGGYGQPPTYQPNADGPAAMIGSVATIPGLHLIYASSVAGAPGAFGPGVARFNGIALEAYSTDGDLSTGGAPGVPGFFARPQSTYGGAADEFSGLGSHSGLLAWGRWFHTEARIMTRENVVALGSYGYYDSANNFFYITGATTPAANLPQSGLARYGSVGADADTTSRFSSDTRVSGELAVLWGTASPKVGIVIRLQEHAGGGDYRTYGSIATAGGLGSAAGLQQSELSLRAGTATFGGVVPASCGIAPCQGAVEGFFAGASAEAAGVAFQFNGSMDAYLAGVSGVAAFAFSEFIVPPAPPSGGVTLLSQGDPNAFAISLAHSGTLSGPPASGPPAMATQSASAQLETFATVGGSPGSQVNIGRGTATSPAAETGGDSLITWGRWTSGTTTGTAGVAPLTLGANQGFHYVVGAATPAASMPASGTATFTLMGATKPTFGDGALAPGTFTGSMAVQWGGAAATKVGVDFNITMPGDGSYRLMSNGGVSTPTTSLISTSTGSAFSGPAAVTFTGAGTGRACTGACSGNVNGFFAGPSAERAGAVYMIGFGGTGIQGAAAFTR